MSRHNSSFCSYSHQHKVNNNITDLIQHYTYQQQSGISSLCYGTPLELPSRTCLTQMGV